MLQDVCIYDPVPVVEVMPSKTALETLAFRLLPYLINDGEMQCSDFEHDEDIKLVREGFCRTAFLWAEAFLKVAKEQSE